MNELKLTEALRDELTAFSLSVFEREAQDAFVDHVIGDTTYSLSIFKCDDTEGIYHCDVDDGERHAELWNNRPVEVIKPHNRAEVVKASIDFFISDVRGHDDDEQYCMGFETSDGQIFDINIWDGDKLAEDGLWHCQVYDAFDDEGYHCRGFNSVELWSVPKADEGQLAQVLS